MKNFNEPDKLYATLLRKYNVSSFRELTVKQRVEILEGLNELSKKKEEQDGNKIHSTEATKGQRDVASMLHTKKVRASSCFACT